MWHMRIPRGGRRCRGFILAFLLISLVSCVFLFSHLSSNYPQDLLPSSSLYDIENLNLFLNRTPVKYNFHIFYYPWYGNPEYDAGRYLHWNHRRLSHWLSDKAVLYPRNRHEPPDDIGSNFYPWLGLYSSRSAAILDKHMRMIRMSGAGTLSVSWYPPGMADDEGRSWDDLMPLLLDTADKYQLKVCFHIEPYTNRTADNVLHWSLYLIKNHGAHPAFYRYRGQPFFYIYDSYRISSDDWRRVLLPARQTARHTYFVGLILKSKDCRELASAGFDAAYSYFAAEAFTEASSPQKWSSIVKECSPLQFIASVGPGYIDTGVRPWNGDTTRSRDNGKYYRRMFNALPKRSAGGEEKTIATITSFNEWHEGTQIEPAADVDISKNLTYQSYHQGPFTYIHLTRELIFAHTL